MQAYDLVTKDWLVSHNARLVYRTAAIVSLAFFPTIVAILMTVPAPAYLKQLLFLSLFATALNGAAMEAFLFRFDNSGVVKQVFWFCVMLFVPIGPALYCFLVYSRSNVFKRSGSAEARGGMPEPMENRDLH